MQIHVAEGWVASLTKRIKSLNNEWNLCGKWNPTPPQLDRNENPNASRPELLMFLCVSALISGGTVLAERIRRDKIISGFAIWAPELCAVLVRSNNWISAQKECLLRRSEIISADSSSESHAIDDKRASKQFDYSRHVASSRNDEIDKKK